MFKFSEQKQRFNNQIETFREEMQMFIGGIERFNKQTTV